jgi:hypothetical protein
VSSRKDVEAAGLEPLGGAALPSAAIKLSIDRL